MNPPLFRTVTGRDFGRSIAWSKARGNPLAAAIRKTLLELKKP